MLIKIIIATYVGALVGSRISFYLTNFIRPKGLWNLVPYRVSGWRSYIRPRRIYIINWIWQSVDFKSCTEGEGK